MRRLESPSVCMNGRARSTGEAATRRAAGGTEKERGEREDRRDLSRTCSTLIGRHRELRSWSCAFASLTARAVAPLDASPLFRCGALAQDERLRDGGRVACARVVEPCCPMQEEATSGCKQAAITALEMWPSVVAIAVQHSGANPLKYTSLDRTARSLILIVASCSHHRERDRSFATRPPRSPATVPFLFPPRYVVSLSSAPLLALLSVSRPLVPVLSLLHCGRFASRFAAACSAVP